MNTVNHTHTIQDRFLLMSILRVITQSMLIGVLAIWTEGSTFLYVWLTLMFICFSITNLFIWRCVNLTEKNCHLLLIIETIMVLPLFTVVENGAYYGFFMVGLVSACLFFFNLTTRLIYSLLFLVLGISFVSTLDPDTAFIDSVIILFPYLFMYFTASSIRQLDDQKRRLQFLNSELSRLSQSEKELAIVEERNRMARDIHDTVAHRASALIIQLQAALTVLDNDSNHARKNVETSLNIARSMLLEMRESVRSLSESNGTVQAIITMLKEFEVQAGTTINFNNIEILTKLPPNYLLIIYRCLQESVTNSHRHGKASTVDITVSEFVSTIELTVVDNGVGCTDLVEGFGLRGMRERLAEISGILHISNLPFSLKITIPRGQTKK